MCRVANTNAVRAYKWLITIAFKITRIFETTSLDALDSIKGTRIIARTLLFNTNKSSVRVAHQWACTGFPVSSFSFLSYWKNYFKFFLLKKLYLNIIQTYHRQFRCKMSFDCTDRFFAANRPGPMSCHRKARIGMHRWTCFCSLKTTRQFWRLYMLIDTGYILTAFWISRWG